MVSVPASKRTQTGASALLILIILTMAAFIVLCVIKLYPSYYDQWTIMKVVDGFEESPDLDTLSVAEIEKRFALRLQTNSIRDFNFNESVVIEKDDIAVYFDIDYERRVHIYKNVDAVVTFKETREFNY